MIILSFVLVVSLWVSAGISVRVSVMATVTVTVTVTVTMVTVTATVTVKYLCRFSLPVIRLSIAPDDDFQEPKHRSQKDSGASLPP